MTDKDPFEGLRTVLANFATATKFSALAMQAWNGKKGAMLDTLEEMSDEDLTKASKAILLMRTRLNWEFDRRSQEDAATANSGEDQHHDDRQPGR